MTRWRRIIPVLALALAFAGTVRADMMRTRLSDAECPSALCGGEPANPRPVNSSKPDVLSAASVELDCLPISFPPDVRTDAGRNCEQPPVPPLTEGHGSLSLYLCGLISVGAFRSISSIRKLSLGALPDWYHDGGPFQIGHSLAIGPDLHLTPVYCFVQPDCTPRNCLPQYHRGTIVSLWRKSQFTPTVLSSRGPPELSTR